MKRNPVKYLILLLLPLLLALSKDVTDVIEFTSIPDRLLDNITKQALPDGSQAWSVRDICYRDDIDLKTDMLISFDKKASASFRDDTGRYAFYSAEYIMAQDEKSLGKGSASFFKRDHGVTIVTTEGVWLGSCDDLGSFMIELRFRPNDARNGVLFSRIGYFSGSKKGIDIKIRDGIPVTSFYNMFMDDRGGFSSATLSGGKKVSPGTWYHLSVSYDRITGKLSKHIDGREEDVRYMTATGKPSESVMAASFGYQANDGSFKCTDLPIAVIGKDYNGLIDEFRISYASLEEIERSKDIAYKKHKRVDTAGRVPYNREGIVTGPVTDFGAYGTSVSDLSWDGVIKEGTFIWMEFRTSDRIFDEHDPGVKWYRVVNGQKKISSMKADDGELLRGRYCQWRAHLVVSPEGDLSPLMKKVSMRYWVDVPPSVPFGLEVADSGDGYVTLKWVKNADSDLMGYKIYYGTQAGRVDGIISGINGGIISNRITPGKYVSVKVDSSVINENKVADRRNVLLYPFLENTVLYYFSVTAYDTYKPGTPYNHESELSRHVTGRPYGGSQIR